MGTTKIVWLAAVAWFCVAGATGPCEHLEHCSQLATGAPPAADGAAPLQGGGPAAPVAAALKEAWPELVGQAAGEARAVIEAERPELTIIPPDTAVTQEYREDRVRIYADNNNRVMRTPKVG
ncbi:MAG: potato inhibitor I family-domain-containing protein [Monoraphidium minutum]|nr:MAG: potato inhibitor I family-domain-containing protein [Monoraphidium minutum]